jgi:hypothetical protein
MRNPSPQYRYEHYDPRRAMTMPRYTIPRTAHCDTGALAMTTLQAWILIAEAGIIALYCLVGLFRGRAA